MKTKPFLSILILEAIVLFSAQSLVAQQIISGTILDNGTGQPVKGADVFYYDEKGRLLKGDDSDSRGRFEFETTIEPGRDIKIIINKHGEYTYTAPPKTVKKDGTDFGEIFLTKGPPGTHKVNGHVRRWWFNKGIRNAIISTYDLDNNRIPVLTDSTGYYEFSTRIEFGDEIEFRIEKPGYKTKEQKRILNKRDKHFNFRLIRKLTLCDGFFIASGALAATSAVTILKSEKIYDRYNEYSSQDYHNPTRENDYQHANKLHHTSIVEGIGALAFGAGGGICACVRKKNKKPGRANGK